MQAQFRAYAIRSYGDVICRRLDVVLLDKVCKIMLIVWDMGEFRFFFVAFANFYNRNVSVWVRFRKFVLGLCQKRVSE